MNCEFIGGARRQGSRRCWRGRKALNLKSAWVSRPAACRSAFRTGRTCNGGEYAEPIFSNKISRLPEFQKTVPSALQGVDKQAGKGYKAIGGRFNQKWTLTKPSSCPMNRSHCAGMAMTRNFKGDFA